ncbi:MAG TPA: translation initiation factor IF-2 [Myxococcota bacterium]|jgi:translation initiation factor IF-2|nr:translation initiation factor IF-2 [Myxococcota bacterium]
MAKTRAYKIAEELGIDKNELVEKAKALGIDLKSPMASLEDAEALMLREKLGAKTGGKVVEERVERGGGVIVRRKRVVAPPPAPEPAPARVEPVPEPIAVAEAPPVVHAAEAIPAEPVAPVEMPEPEPEAMPPAVPEPGSPESPAVGVRARPLAPAPPPPADAAAAAAAEAERKGKQRKRVREVVNLKEQEQFARQVTGRVAVRRPVAVDPRSFVSPRRKRRDEPAAPRPAAAAAAKPARRVVRVEGTISVAELARQLGVKAPELQGRLMALGTMVSLHQAIDIDTAGKVAKVYGFEVQDTAFKEAEFFAEEPTEEGAGNLVPRPPIVTVMGHVDHGKTSLLDALREANVVAGEAGGITQHIGAYQVSIGGKKITFIDTPGHEAFTMMRARGAKVTDIVILVVAATEGIMPQTQEAIDHARAAGVPIIVAVNKIDLPDANPQLVRQRLMEHGLVPEDFGGDTICVNVSALKKMGLDQLLEMINLQADVLELEADPARRATGVVLEAELDRGRGPVATVLVQDGTLRRGDVIVVGTTYGRVRAMQNEHGQRLDEAGPSTPVQVIGLSAVAEAGNVFHAVESERDGKQIAEHRLAEQRGRTTEARPKLSLEDFFAQAQEGGTKTLGLVLKADVQGSVEALRESLVKLSTDAVKVDVIHTGVGAITESDVMLAKASNAIVVGFHVRPDNAARRAAEGQGVDLRMYQIIYEVTDDVRKAMAGLLPPTIKEVALGRAEVRKTFAVPRIGTIAGSYVLDGLIRRGALCRLIRDGVQIYEGKIGSLKRFKDDAREVAAGFECGIGIDGYNDLKLGDVIEAYERQETPATLG